MMDQAPDVRESRTAVPFESPTLPDDLDPDLTEPPEWTTRAGRRTLREKLAAGLRGLKYAMRGDSSFFAHAYRGLLIILAGALLGVPPSSWCLLVLTLVLVFVAELSHSAIDTLARSLGDPEEQGLRVAREIATAGVLVAVVAQAVVTSLVFALRLNDLFAWW